MTVKIPKPAPPKPWRSGHCGLDNPPEIHSQCRGSYDGRPCKCVCHQAVPIAQFPPATRLLAESRHLHEWADGLLTADIEGMDWETSVRIAAELAAARKAIGAAEEFIAKHAGNVWPGKWREAQHIEGVGTAQPYRTKSRVKWDHDALVKAVIDRHMTDSDGVLPDPYTAARWLTDAAQVGYWRVGKLTDLDIEADEYRSSELGNIRLRITSDHMVGDTTGEKA